MQVPNALSHYITYTYTYTQLFHYFYNKCIEDCYVSKSTYHSQSSSFLVKKQNKTNKNKHNITDVQIPQHVFIRNFNV